MTNPTQSSNPNTPNQGTPNPGGNSNRQNQRQNPGGNPQDPARNPQKSGQQDDRSGTSKRGPSSRDSELEQQAGRRADDGNDDIEKDYDLETRAEDEEEPGLSKSRGKDSADQRSGDGARS